ELVLSITNDLELDSAAKKLSVQEPAFSITESVNIIEHDIGEGNNQKSVISSEITTVQEPDFTNTDDLEPDTAAKSIFVQEHVFSIIETVDIIEHDIDEENNQKPVISSEITSVQNPPPQIIASKCRNTEIPNFGARDIHLHLDKEKHH
ncbi:Hypothetical protein CINCED_3A010127, partial [Cinara cedri]